MRLYVCLCQIKRTFFQRGQKNIFSNIEFFEFSSEIENFLKFLNLEKTGVKKTFFLRGEKNILLIIEFFEFFSEVIRNTSKISDSIEERSIAIILY